MPKDDVVERIVAGVTDRLLGRAEGIWHHYLRSELSALRGGVGEPVGWLANVSNSDDTYSENFYHGRTLPSWVKPVAGREPRPLYAVPVPPAPDRLRKALEVARDGLEHAVSFMVIDGEESALNMPEGIDEAEIAEYVEHYESVSAALKITRTALAEGGGTELVAHKKSAGNCEYNRAVDASDPAPDIAAKLLEAVERCQKVFAMLINPNVAAPANITLYANCVEAETIARKARDAARAAGVKVEDNKT